MDDDFYPKDAYDDDYFVPIRGEINEVLPGKLYISDNYAARNVEILQEKGIRRIIALGNSEEQHCYIDHSKAGHTIEYCWIYIDDKSDEPISDYFHETLQFISESPEPVLVYCWAGISRSATIVLAYLIQGYKLSYFSAWNHLKTSRLQSVFL